MARRGHEIHVITVQHQPSLPEAETIDGVAIFRVPCMFLPELRIAHNFRWLSLSYHPANLKRIRNYLKENGIQILHQNGQIFDLALATAHAKRKLKIPSVITIHANALHSNPIYDKILSIIDRNFVKNCIIKYYDEIIVSDSNYKDYVIDRYEREDTIVVPLGICHPLDIEEPNEIWQKKYNYKNRPFLVSLGHLHENRSRIDLIEAMPLILAEIPDALLFIIGESYYKGSIDLVNKMKIQNSVVFTGALPRREALGLMKQSKLQALWSNRAKPGLGVASLEAMSMGVPMVSTLREDLIPDAILKDREHLFEIESGNAPMIAKVIIGILKHPELARRVGEKGKKFVLENYTWDAVCNRIEGIFRNLLNKSKVIH